MAEKTKEQRVKTEFARLKKLTKGMDAGKQALALMNAEELAFMRVTLADLKQAINRAGCVEGYQNGANQFGKKTTADLNAYNALVKNYAYTLKRFEEMVPEGGAGGGMLEAFLRDE